MQEEHRKNEQFKCQECGQTFNSEQEQREHQQKSHAGKSRGAAQGQGQHSGQSKQ